MADARRAPAASVGDRRSLFESRGAPMKACVAVVLSAGLLAACSAPSNPEADKAAVPAAPKAAAPEATAKVLGSGIDKVNMDASAKPQDDFYRYVNGHWLD